MHINIFLKIKGSYSKKTFNVVYPITSNFICIFFLFLSLFLFYPFLLSVFLKTLIKTLRQCFLRYNSKYMYSFKDKKEGEEKPRVVAHVKWNSLKPIALLPIRYTEGGKPFKIIFIEKLKK